MSTPSTKTWLGYDTRSARSGLVMLAVDLLNPFRQPEKFAWGEPCVISSLGGLGDLFIHLPLIAGLVREAGLRGIEVQVALMPVHAWIGRACGWKVLEFDSVLTDFFKKPGSVRITDLVRRIRATRRKKIGLWIDLTGNAVNALILKLSGIRKLAGRITRGGRSLTDHPLLHVPGDNEYEHCQKLAGYFGCRPDQTIFERLVSDRQPNGLTVFALSTACRWRNWPLTNFLEIIRAFPNRKFAVAGFSKELVESDRAVLEEMRTLENVSDQVDMLGLPEMIGLIANCAAIVCNDTGAAHIARAYHRPGAVIFGPGSLIFWGKGALRLFHDRTCLHYPCIQWNCKTPHNWCMIKISAQEVISHLANIENFSTASAFPKNLT